MNNLVCPKCKIEYDFSEKLPRLFPNCGHTFCSQCLLKMLKRKKKIFICPKDKKKCDSTVFEKGLDYFPINFAIKNLMQPENDSDSEYISGIDDYSDSDQDDKIEIISEQQTKLQQEKEKKCQQHNKKIELVCLTDLKVICSDCVMFGGHKEHKYFRFNNFKQKALKDLYNIKEQSENLNPSQLTEKLIEKEKMHLTQKVNTKKEALTNQVKKNMKMLRETLKYQEKQILENINQHFFKFDNSIEQIYQNLQKIYEDEQNLKNQFQQIEQQLQEKDPSYDIILPKVYDKDQNLFQISKDIDFKRNKQSQLTKIQIHDNLNKLSIKGNFEKLNDEIKKCIHFDVAQIKDRHRGSIDSTQSFMKKRQLIRKSSIDINFPDNSIYNQDNIGLKKLDSMISDIVNKDSDELSLNAEDEIKGNQILQDSLIKPYREIQSYKDVNQVQDMDVNTHNSNLQKTQLQLWQSRKRLSTNQKNTNINEAKNRQTITFKRQRNNDYFTQDHTRKSSSNFNQISMNMGKEKSNNKNNYNKMRSFTPLYSRMGSQSQTNFYQQHNKGVNKKDYSNKKISENDLDYYISDILNDNNVQILDLSFNKITTKGFKILLKKLENHISLEYINLSNNLLDEKSVIILEKYGKNLRNINRINLSNNKITNNMNKKSIYKQRLKKKGIDVNLIL